MTDNPAAVALKPQPLSEALYRALLETASDVIFAYDLDRRLLYVNPAFERLTGYTTEELHQQQFINYLHPEDASRMLALLEGVYQGNSFEEVEYRIVTRVGDVKWCESSWGPLRDDQGRQVGVQGREHDITERKQAEIALRHNEKRLLMALDAGNMVAWDWHIRADQVYRSHNTEQVLGRGPDALEGRSDNFLQLIHPDDRPRVQAELTAALDGHAEYDTEFRILWPDGSVHWMHDRASIIRAPDRQALRMTGVTWDVTMRVAAEDLLERERELLQKVFDRIPVLIAMYGPNAKVLRLNREFERLTGWSTSEARTIDLLEKCYPDPAYRAGVRQSMESLREGWCDLVMTTRDGSRLETSWSHIRLADETHVSIGIDIRERKRAEETLREADRRKDEFLATLAHELRNPLAPIRNAIQFLRMRASGDADIQRAREIIDRQVQQLARLVDDLLDVSRITRGKIELRKELVDLATVVERAIETSRPLIEAGRHELSVTLPAGPVYLDADLTRLAQVIGNLLNNAAKYTRERGRITLAAAREDGTVVVRVRDTGIGIPAGMLSHIFEMFAQVDTSLERAQGGLGIGLTLVKRLAEMHGGTVHAHSDGAGRGSEFVLRLPLADLSALDDLPAIDGQIDSTSDKHKPRRILVVDDNADSAHSLAMYLKLLGNEVRVVHDGPRALAEAQSWLPEVVLLDIGLPGMNGYEVARRLRSHPELRQVLLVAQTGLGQAEDRRRSREAGFDHHLVKPVDPAVLQQFLSWTGVGGSRNHG